MKNSKILLSGAMLLLALGSASVATYAWFSNNTAVSLDGLEVNVTASEGIQVSTDAATWKANISVADITDNAYVGNINQIPAVLRATSSIGSQSVGNFEMFNGVLVEGGTTTLDSTAAAPEADGSAGDYVAFDLFLKTATAEDIYLNVGSGTVAAAASVGLEYALRVGFLDQGTDATSTPATARALATGTSASQKIWEPNALTHTVFALANGATDGVKSSYYGLKAAGTGLTTTAWAGDAVHYGLVNTITPDTDGSPFAQIPGNILFSVTPGITKVRIYIWVEGQDIDCENAVSLGLQGVITTINLVKGA